MRRTICTMLLAVLLPAAAAAQPLISYEADADFLKLPEGMYLGETPGVAVNSAGHVFVFTRADLVGDAYRAISAQLLEFDADGNFVREIGRNLFGFGVAHAVRVDAADNIWTADRGADVVVKFDPEGRVAMVFGRRQDSSDETAGPLPHPDPPLPPVPGYFRQVTDVAFDSLGNIYISDGYINARIAKYGPDGLWVTSWGTHGTGPGQFDTPHSIAIDAENRVYVADRNNARIQVFDSSGNFLRFITIDAPVPDDARVVIGEAPVPGPDGQYPVGNMKPGAPWALCITPGPDQVLFASDAFPGRIYKLNLDGEVLGMLGRAGKREGEFGWVHGIACPSENTLYVAEIINWRVQKLTLRP